LIKPYLKSILNNLRVKIKTILDGMRSKVILLKRTSMIYLIWKMCTLLDLYSFII